MSTPLKPPGNPSGSANDFAKIRLYVESDMAQGSLIELEATQTHYLANVMRQKSGDHILVFNGRDGEWLASLTSISKKKVILELQEQTRPQVVTPDLELLFAPIKKLRLDYLVQKATELGVSALRPVITQYTNAKAKPEKMEANVIEAAEQSGRLDVPEVRNVVKLRELTDDWPAGRTLLFCDEAPDSVPITAALSASTHDGPWSVLIGPEGGFAEDERLRLRAMDGSVPVSLGPRIMRADTAAVAALAAFQALKGDWNA